MDNTNLDIKNLEFNVEDTGIFFSKTYTEYNWKFLLDGIIRKISLYHSKILGRRTIYLGNQKICCYQRYTYNFQYSFTLDVHTISINQTDDTYILKIDGISFNKLLNEQKLKRFNIIKEIFSEKDGKNKKLNIKPLMTYKGGRGNMIISGRSENQNDILYKTNIYSEIRENDINNEENDENIINTSSKRNNNINNNFSESNIISTNDEYNYYQENPDEQEFSEEMSNKAIDGGDSRKDEDEEDDEDNEDDNNITIKENLDLPENDIFQPTNIDANNLDENEEDEEEPEELKVNEEINTNSNINTNDINININNKIKEEDESSSSDEEEKKEKINEEKKEKKILSDFNEINNELQPIKFKKKKEKEKEKEKNKENKKKKIKNKKSDNYNYDEDDIYNINNDNNIDNDENKINNDKDVDLLGEEFYNSSRDKDLYNNNIDNNFNINYFISQQKL